MISLAKILADLGTSASSVHKDIYKAIKYYACDRALIVRCASINVSSEKCCLSIVVWLI